MYIYCLITDRNYLVNTMVLIEKIRDRKIFIICLDKYSEEKLKEKFNNLNTFLIEDFEKKNNIFEEKKSKKNLEYIFMLKSYLVENTMLYADDNDYIVYLDSDLFFLSKIENFEKEIYNASVFITPHRFDKTNLTGKRYGIYNAGLVVFKKNEEGKKILNWWKKKCIESCSIDMIDGEVFADQKYLDKFTELSPEVKVISHVGINLGPWNLHTYLNDNSITDDNEVQYNISFSNEEFYINDNKLLIYHFHGFKKTLFGMFVHSLNNYVVKKIRFGNRDQNVQLLYNVYKDALQKNYKNINHKNKFTPGNLIFFLKNLIRKNIFY